MAKAAILMGSKSDFPVVKPAVKVLKDFGAEVEVRVISAQRTPEEAHEFASKAKKNGVEVIICAAGKAAHLGGVIAAYTTLPVIGLPVKTDMMGGLDSLLSIVQMPSGIPVATVAIDGAQNAALLAVEILAVSDEALREKLAAARKASAEKVLAKNAEIEAKYHL